jgi:hypothetical protein
VSQTETSRTTVGAEMPAQSQAGKTLHRLTASPWRRIERRDDHGAVTDWVEVGQCARCGRGVDRAFPVEYRAIGDTVVCRSCSPRLSDRLAFPH